MKVVFNPLLVILSIAVAIFASYVSLNIAYNITQARGSSRLQWLMLGALAMGVGIWSMHFVGMLAFEMPGMTMAYNIPQMILSVVVAIAASALALLIVSREVVPNGSIISGGIAMAAAIAGMHYIGMYSMRMAATIEWNYYLVALSVLIALVASFGALMILIRLRGHSQKHGTLLLASTIMGIAISGMHYVGMYAATFVHTPDLGIEESDLIVSGGLKLATLTTTLFILGVALLSSLGQRFWERRDRLTHEIIGHSEEKFRLLVAAVKDYAIFMVDPGGHITTWNSGAEHITGYTEREVLGKHLSIFYTAEDIENNTSAKELGAALKSGHFEGHGQRLRKDGSVYFANIVLSPLWGSDGELRGFSKVTRDITQFVQAERRMKQINEELEIRVKTRTQEILQREVQLRTIANAVPVLIAQLDKDERFLFANDTFCKWFQRDEKDVIGHTFRELLGEDRYPANEPYIKKAFAGETAVYERESTSGETKAILSINFIPEFDQDHRPCGFIIVASNITIHKEIQSELQKAKEAAEVANATKSAFLANMSHEIRTPLGAVLGFSELVASGEMTPPERAKSVEVIKRNGRLLSNIINDILDLSKVEAGRLEIEKVETSFTEIMNEITAVLSLEATSKGIDLKVTSEGVIPTHFKTDTVRLRQILLNIVGNAIKFTHQGTVNVKLKLIPDGREKMLLAFIIKDTGVGIKPEQVGRLFMPFTQADPSTTRKFGGTGLGLVLSKKLANALGGDVVLCDTAPGIGSTFMITIDPDITDKILFTNMKPEAQMFSMPSIQTNTDLDRYKILLVDDSLDNQLLIQKILRLAGAVVDTANNGREAVEMAAKVNYSLILMDLQMPEMDGYEATKLLRAQGYKKPIIALTAHAMKEERQRSLRSGFNDHITKPIDQKSLIKVLSQYSA